MEGSKVVEKGILDQNLDDQSIKNQWRWNWLDVIVDGFKLEDCVKKIDKPGHAFCSYCNKQINYSSRGIIALKNHVSTDLHRKRRKEITTNTLLPVEKYLIFDEESCVQNLWV